MDAGGPYYGTIGGPLTVDRCYIHGDDTHDVRAGVIMNADAVAIVDSYISDIHLQGFDSQAAGASIGNGPFKIVNNYLSASTENVMFGGAGGANNPYIPSDIEIRNNYFFKPEAWIVKSYPWNTAQWSVKNLLEFKNARRVLVDSNILEGNWTAAQYGHAVLFDVITSQSGNNAVVDDITFTNNVLKNVESGFASNATDFTCKLPACTNVGEVKRIVIKNNLLLLRPKNATYSPIPQEFKISANQSDFVFQHNTTTTLDGSSCTNSEYFTLTGGTPYPKPPFSATTNLWILDNVECQQPTGDWQIQGTAGLTVYMGAPGTPPYDLTQRFYGNVMYVPIGSKVQAFPVHNCATTLPFTFEDPTAFDYLLVTRCSTHTSDGTLSGVDMSKLQ